MAQLTLALETAGVAIRSGCFAFMAIFRGLSIPIPVRAGAGGYELALPELAPAGRAAGNFELADRAGGQRFAAGGDLGG